ncbi:MAG: phosphoribosyl-AMP cyclohydrolase, partial [Pseudomonadota bacterium]|nr:phosphoribosyl-AMP cyclohydrolase [Pseudomonadota bacterium]
DTIRLDRAGVRSYFLGDDPAYPNDYGFLNRGWKRVEFQSAAGPVLQMDGGWCTDMGHYAFINTDGTTTDADYTFIYHKLDGRILISLHHSSLTWLPAEDN